MYLRNEFFLSGFEQVIGKKIKRGLLLALSRQRREKYFRNRNEGNKLEQLRFSPRYVPGVLDLSTGKIHYTDSHSKYFAYNEIFQRQIYRFRDRDSSGVIIDGGANIGLASIFFGAKYPGFQNVAYQPDPGLSQNLKLNLTISPLTVHES